MTTFAEICYTLLMMKSEKMTELILQETKNGAFGPSGSVFPGIRELCARYGVANKTALSVFRQLKKAGALFDVGKKNYLLAGRAAPDAPLFRALGERRPVLGFHTCEIDNQFMSNIVGRFVRMAGEAGYEVLILCSNNDKERELRQMTTFVRLGVRGFASFSRAYFEHADFFSRLPVPFVLSGSVNPELPTNYVTTSNFHAGIKAAEHLLSCGYRTFCYVGNNPEKETRRKGFLSHLREAGVPSGNIFTFRYENGRLPEGFYRLASGATRQNRLAVFCYHDLIAMRIYEIARQSVKKIPDEIGVVGFDNLPLSDLLEPRLCSIAYSYEDLAANCFSILKAQIEDPLAPPRQTELPSYLIVKESTAKR